MGVVKRMARQVVADGRLLVLQALGVRSTRAWRRGRPPGRRLLAEQRYLRGARLRALGGVERDAPTQQRRAACSIASNAPPARTSASMAPVDDALVDAAAEIEEVVNGPPALRAATMASMADSPVP